MSKLTEHFRQKSVQIQPTPSKPAVPVWAGPESDAENGGITFSLLSRFLVCRERFRLRVVEGLRPKEDFNHRLFYGGCWHLCMQCQAAAPPRRAPGWEQALADFVQAEARKFPLQAQQIDHWRWVCHTQFPHYLRYWADSREKAPASLLAERVFKVPYPLPSGRTVYLRGKWDEVVLRDGKEILLVENKTKGDIQEQAIQEQLRFDLQTMLYLIALGFANDGSPGLPDNELPTGCQVAGVIYNVVRRPLSGGKYSIVRHKPTKSNLQGEGKVEFYRRLEDLIREDPGHFFKRWQVSVTPGDAAHFRRECLDPVLEQLCEWWDWVSRPGDPFGSDFPKTDPQRLHWRHPYGVHNEINEGYDEVGQYLTTGSLLGLERSGELFKELQ